MSWIKDSQEEAKSLISPKIQQFRRKAKNARRFFKKQNKKRQIAGFRRRKIEKAQEQFMENLGKEIL